MSNVIKSFRVLEKDTVQDIIKKTQDTENVDDRVKEVLLHEAKKEAEVIVKIAEERSRQILKDVEIERVNIISNAEIEAGEIHTEAKKAGYDEGYEKGFEEGLEKGFDKGYKDGKVVADNLIEESLTIKNDYIDTRNQLAKDLEGDIIHLVTEIFEKVLGQKMEEDENLIKSLVLKGIKNLDPTNKLTIIVSKEDFDTLEAARDEILAKASLINELEIKYDINLSRGDSILETSKGNIDISIKDQIKEIKETLKTILDNE